MSHVHVGRYGYIYSNLTRPVSWMVCSQGHLFHHLSDVVDPVVKLPIHSSIHEIVSHVDVVATDDSSNQHTVRTVASAALVAQMTMPKACGVHEHGETYTKTRGVFKNHVTMSSEIYTALL